MNGMFQLISFSVLFTFCLHGNKGCYFAHYLPACIVLNDGLKRTSGDRVGANTNILTVLA